jgi:DNA-binding transcriptional LysR family regulator
VTKITIRQLEVFAVVVEAGSFREAAERLHISQASISNHISALESALGARLFARQRGMLATATERGVLAYKEAKILIDRFGSFTNLFSKDGRRIKQLKIGAHTFVVNLIGDTLAQYAAEHPDVTVGVEVGPFEFVMEKIHREELDLGIVYTTGPIPGVHSVPLWLEPLALYVSKSHELARNPKVTILDLMKSPLITVPRKTKMRSLLDETLFKMGINDCQIALEADSFSVVNQSLIRNVGFALMFKRPIDSSPIKDQLHEIPLEVPHVEARQVISRSAQNDPTVLGCVEFINENNILKMSNSITMALEISLKAQP